jgi:3-dehydroquinate dehydratase-1
MNFESFVLAASTASLADEPAAREHADAVEFRLDLAETPLAALRDYTGSLPILATNRVEYEGGEAADTAERITALSNAVGTPPVEAVDVELEAVHSGDANRALERARDHGVTVVVSVHDFETTPTRERMHELLAAAGEYGDVAKLAVAAQSPEDVLDLLTVTREATVGGATVATMAMGRAGRHSRAVAPLYGSRIGYAPVDPVDATAPGQYDLATLSNLVDRLRSE